MSTNDDHDAKCWFKSATRQNFWGLLYIYFDRNLWAISNFSCNMFQLHQSKWLTRNIWNKEDKLKARGIGFVRINFGGNEKIIRCRVGHSRVGLKIRHVAGENWLTLKPHFLIDASSISIFKSKPKGFWAQLSKVSIHEWLSWLVRTKQKVNKQTKNWPNGSLPYGLLLFENGSC